MNRTLGLWAVAAMAAAALMMPGMAKAQAQDVHVAVAGPLTGQYAPIGEQMRRGAAMAVADINAAGGVLGHKLVLEEADDACDPKQAVAVANQLAGKGVVYVAGHFCSGSSIPAAGVYAEEGIVMVSPGSTNPKLTESGYASVFRMCGRDDQQGKVAGDYLASHYKGKNIAILNDKSAYGRGLADETKAAMNAAGEKEKLFESYTAGETDYSALVSRLKDEAIDVVYLGGYHTEAALILRQMRGQGLMATLISGDALATHEFGEIAGADADGTLMTFGPDPRKRADAAEIVKHFQAVGFDPEGYTLYTYAALQVFAQAAAKAGVTTPDALAPVMHKEAFSTVLGPISFDAKGDVKAPSYVFYRWEHGTYAELPDQ